MTRYLAIAAAIGAAMGLGMSLVYNGIEQVPMHIFNAIVGACYCLVPGFLIWLSVRLRKPKA